MTQKRISLFVLAVCMLPSLCSAQVFPNAFWNKNNTCSGPECAAQQVVQLQPAPQPVRNVLRAVAGPVVYQPVQTTVQYPTVSTVQSYGSSGSAVQSYGSSGSATTQWRQNGFKKAFLEAVKRSRASGEINMLEATVLRIKSNNSRFLEQVEQHVRETAIAEGVVEGQAIDWDALIEFIERLIPLIIKLIDLFGYISPNTEMMYASNTGPDFFLAA